MAVRLLILSRRLQAPAAALLILAAGHLAAAGSGRPRPDPAGAVRIEFSLSRAPG